jgi:hypothetical protein
VDSEVVTAVSWQEASDALARDVASYKEAAKLAAEEARQAGEALVAELRVAGKSVRRGWLARLTAR